MCFNRVKRNWLKKLIKKNYGIFKFEALFTNQPCIYLKFLTCNGNNIYISMWGITQILATSLKKQGLGGIRAIVTIFLPKYKDLPDSAPCLSPQS